METSYAQALWQLIERGATPKKALEQLRENLETKGRMALMPRIALAFARIAERNTGKRGVTLTVAHESDERRAKSAIKDVLAEIQATPKDVTVKVDDSLIGGWRLEGRELLVDASWKRHLLSIYNRATQ